MADRLLFVLLLVDAVVLAVLEVFYLPLRLDGDILPRLNGWPFPIAVVVAVVATPWLVGSAARLSPRLIVAGAPLALWLLTVLVLGFGSPGGGLVLPPDWRSLLLVAGGALPAAMVLGNALGRAARRV